MRCPRCFYLDRRLGIAAPQGPAFTLNSAVDALLKKEFDFYRARKEPHPIMVEHGLDLLPFQHEKMDKWREALHGGVEHHHAPTNFYFTGGVDDIWVRPNGEIHVVDYKATAKAGEVNLDSEWQLAYKRQAEIYQWLLKENGFKVSPIAYFVYCNGILANEDFRGKLDFKISLIPHEGSTAWVEDALLRAHKCLMSDELPSASERCEMCAYRKACAQVESPPR